MLFSVVNIAHAIQLANQHQQSGNLREAERLCQWVLSVEPNHPAAIYLLGIISYQTGRFDLAIHHVQALVQLCPQMAEAHNLLGNVLRSEGRTDEAIAAYRNAVKLKEDFAEAFYNLGTTLRESGCVEQAIESFRKALALNPEFLDAANDLGSALREVEQIDEAVAVLSQVVQRAPQSYRAQNNLGNALRLLGRFDEAESAVRAALKLRPDIAEIHVNLGNVLREKGDIEGSITATREAIRLRPQLADAHQNLGSTLLLAGRFKEAWPEFEWRTRCQGMAPSRAAALCPQWDGAELDGRTILLHSDAGLGDAIQCLRYVPLVADRGGRIVLECQGALRGLVRCLRGVERVFTGADPLPAFDVQCALMSLPGVFNTTLQTIPSQSPYLRPDEVSTGKWKQRLSAYSQPRIGLVWAGNPKPRQRSVELSILSRLGAVRGMTFHSLQLGQAGRQIFDQSDEFKVIDHSEGLTDFVETAALVMNLDLVISVDTSVAHLAGALGKPVWVMLPFAPDWRWMLAREDSPWYPTMRLFRQKNLGDWKEVVERMGRELRKIVENGSRPHLC